MEWENIKTAPKDGSKILVHADDRAYVNGDYSRAGKIITVAHWDEGIKYWRGWPMNSHYTVTHWMPLPNSPNE